MEGEDALQEKGAGQDETLEASHKLRKVICAEICIFVIVILKHVQKQVPARGGKFG